MTATIRLFRHPLSGHAHRVELFLSLLGLPFDTVHVDLLKRAHKEPEFLAKNPLGQVPVIEDGDVTLFDSNAILVYLATRYDEGGRWLPRTPVEAARVQQWLSLAAGPLVGGPGLARLIALFGLPQDPEPVRANARALLSYLDGHLRGSLYLATQYPTIADLAIYSYTAHAPEGGVSLEPYPHVRAWLERIESLPGFVPMQRTATGA